MFRVPAFRVGSRLAKDTFLFIVRGVPSPTVCLGPPIFARYFRSGASVCAVASARRIQLTLCVLPRILPGLAQPDWRSFSCAEAVKTLISWPVPVIRACDTPRSQSRQTFAGASEASTLLWHPYGGFLHNRSEGQEAQRLPRTRNLQGAGLSKVPPRAKTRRNRLMQPAAWRPT